MKPAKLFLFFILFLSLTLFSPKFIHASEIYTTDKLITVDLAKQTLNAWEGGKLQRSLKVSTGLPLAPTVKGSFKIYWKISKQDMKGGSIAYGKYSYRDVPNVMYFYQDYAIHGAYWHNNFGRRASHGCVNVPLQDASWLYDWAQKGTKVEIY